MYICTQVYVYVYISNKTVYVEYKQDQYEKRIHNLIRIPDRPKIYIHIYIYMCSSSLLHITIHIS